MLCVEGPKQELSGDLQLEPTTHPKPNWAWRAKKQVYRPDFVLNHFVHYSLVTRRILDKPEDTSDPVRDLIDVFLPNIWLQCQTTDIRFIERAPFERRVNELTEGFLLHAKTTGPEKTSGWNELCHRKGDGITRSSSCKVGIPSHEIILGEYNLSAGEDGNAISAAFESNCYRHGRVMKDYVPRLESALHALYPI
ncbi:hypothetical protein ACHAW5_007363 [Stephanodiscus triporus]|uniref:Uncharacterized protein n=1 Tax=Stephanodiscus triporus TaxID=2934178 RepID=A0ABD3NTC2_9STRA